MCEKWFNNGYEKHQAAFDSMVGHIGKLNSNNDHRIYEILPLNVIVIPLLNSSYNIPYEKKSNIRTVGPSGPEELLKSTVKKDCWTGDVIWR